METIKCYYCCLVIWLSCLTLQAAGVTRYESYFLALDSIISQHETYELQFKKDISTLHKQLLLARSDEEKCMFCYQLGMIYSYCISDSANMYFDQSIQYASLTGNVRQQNEALLSKVRMHTTIGDFSSASSAFSAIKLDDMPDQFTASCYAAMLSLLQQKSKITGEAFTEEKEHYTRLLLQNITPDDKINDLWAIYWGYEGPDREQKIIEALQQKIMQFNESLTVVSGQMAYMMSESYRKLGNEEMQVKYLCMASMLKIQHNDRNLVSLTELIPLLISQQDYQRAYNYINFIIDSQTQYPDHARSIQISQYMKYLSNEMQQLSHEQQTTTMRYLYGITIAFALVFILLLLLYFSYKKLRKQKERLSEATSSLEVSNQEIRRINKDLKEANFIKEEYIGSLFSNCSTYLDKIEEYRLDINRKAKAGKTQDILKVTAADNPFFINEVKELYKTFDDTFLSIYPNFVKDFNSILSPDGQIVVPEGKLNTDLRIYALIWLGIDNSSKIAELLHISPRTVYNAHVRVRNHALSGNLGAEQFISIVQSLGRE